MNEAKTWLAILGAIVIGVGIGYFVGRSHVKETVITVQSDPQIKEVPKIVTVKGKPDTTAIHTLKQENADLKRFLEELEASYATVPPPFVRSHSIDTVTDITLYGTIEDGDEKYNFESAATVSLKARFYGEPLNAFAINPPIVSQFRIKLRTKPDLPDLPMLPVLGLDALVAYHHSIGAGAMIRMDKLGIGTVLFVEKSPALIGTYSLLYSKDFKLDAMAIYKGNVGFGGVIRYSDFGIGIGTFYKDRKFFLVSYNM